jgi:succinoglycan biosynthesis protein ExoO
MLASFVIPCYNAERTIQRTLLSALNSSVTEIELIVVDDASTDRSTEIVDHVASRHDRVRLIRQSVNRGPSSCRNVGIEHARGWWLSILDADDWVAPERLETLVGYAEAAKLDLIADNQWIVNQRGELQRKRFKSFDSFGEFQQNGTVDVNLHSVIRNRGVGITKPLIRRSFLIENQIRYRHEFKYGEDYRLIFDLVRSGARFGLVDKTLYYAEIGDASLTSDRVAMFNGMIDVLTDVRKSLSRHHDFAMIREIDSAIKQCKYTVSYGAVVDPLKRGRVIAAINALLKNPTVALQLPRRLFENTSKVFPA